MHEHELKNIEQRHDTDGGLMFYGRGDITDLVAEVRRLRDANCDLMDKLEAATGGEDMVWDVPK